MSARSLEALERIVDRDGDADDVLRAVVRALVQDPRISWARIVFLDGGSPVAGPEEGEQDPSRRMQTPIVYRDVAVGELVVDGTAERAFVEKVAALVSAHVLIGWDTSGEAWEP